MDRNEIGDLLFGGALSFINSLADSLAGNITILGVGKVAMLQTYIVHILHVYLVRIAATTKQFQIQHILTKR